MWISSSEASSLSLNKVQSKLNVDLTHGLSSLEVSRRRDIHGFNEVNVGKPDPLWKKYIDQFNNPFILLLLLSAFISVCMKQYDDAVCVTVAIIIVVLMVVDAVVIGILQVIEWYCRYNGYYTDL